MMVLYYLRPLGRQKKKVRSKVVFKEFQIGNKTIETPKCIAYHD